MLKPAVERHLARRAGEPGEFYEAALVAALLRVVRVTAGLAESNGSLPTAGFMTHITCRLTAKNRDQLWNPMLGNRVWATFTFLINLQFCNSQLYFRTRPPNLCSHRRCERDFILILTLSHFNASTLCFCTTLCQLTWWTSSHPTF